MKYNLNTEDREQLQQHGWDPNLLESIEIDGGAGRNYISFEYNGIAILYKNLPFVPNIGGFIGRRLQTWLDNPRHK